MSHLLKLDQQKGMRDNLCVRTSASRNKADFLKRNAVGFFKTRNEKETKKKRAWVKERVRASVCWTLKESACEVKNERLLWSLLEAAKL
jgi:transposase